MLCCSFFGGRREFSKRTFKGAIPHRKSFRKQLRNHDQKTPGEISLSQLLADFLFFFFFSSLQQTPLFCTNQRQLAWKNNSSSLDEPINVGGNSLRETYEWIHYNPDHCQIDISSTCGYATVKCLFTMLHPIPVRPPRIIKSK